MPTLTDVSSVNIESAPIIVNSSSPSFLPNNTTTVSVMVSVNGGAWQMAGENLQANAVPIAVDTYLGSVIAMGTAT